MTVSSEAVRDGGELPLRIPICLSLTVELTPVPVAIIAVKSLSFLSATISIFPSLTAVLTAVFGTYLTSPCPALDPYSELFPSVLLSIYLPPHLCFSCIRTWELCFVLRHLHTPLLL